MKKNFTLLFAAGMFTLAQAQPGTRDNRYDNERGYTSIDYPFDRDNHSGNSRFSNERKRDMQIARINRMYDHRIQQVRYSYFMGRWEKQRQIRFLQEQRQQEIRMVYMKFSKKNKYDGRDNRNGGYDRDNRNGGYDRNDRRDNRNDGYDQNDRQGRDF